MPRLRDRVKDTSSSTGVGNFTLSGSAPSGFQNFGSSFDLNDFFTYAITGGVQWETGIGHLLDSTTLVRDEVFDGSSGQYTFVDFSAGSKDVFVTIPAHLLMDSNSGPTLARISGMDMP